MNSSSNAKIFFGFILVVFGLLVLLDFSLAKAIVFFFAVLLALLIT